MGNAVEDALNRANEEQRAKALQAIQEARQNIKLVSMRGENITQMDVDSVEKNKQIIAEARQHIPFETMQDVDEITPPLPTPPTKQAQFQANVVQLHPDTQENIEQIEQGGGNNYLNDNAVDRAMARQSQETQAQVWEQQQQQQQAMGR
ncbi:MAG: hypothetical protein J0L80_02455 [Chitinophagales bacterium]|nr:hypothetical protein [Chitinophagales bacterium]